MFFKKKGEYETTGRAYTLKLEAPHGTTERDRLWDRLWKTHELVNLGTKLFGDLWLNLRGGLNAGLAKKAQVERDGRILLALGWLTVEAPASAVPEGATIATADQPAETRSAALLARLGDILRQDGIEPGVIEEWQRACGATFAARIREDAVWVDRRGEFNKGAGTLGWTMREAEEMFLDFMMGGAAGYFKIEAKEKIEKSGNEKKKSVQAVDEGDQASGNEKEKKYVIKACNWLGRQWGSKEKNDPAMILQALEKLNGVDFTKFMGRPAKSVMEEMISFITHTEDGDSQSSALDKRLKKNLGILHGNTPSEFNALVRVLAFEELKEQDAKKIEHALSALRSKYRIESEKSKNDWPANARRPLEHQLGLGYNCHRFQNEFSRNDENHRKTDRKDEFSVMLDHALRRISIAHSWAKRAEASRRQFQEAAAGLVDPLVESWVEQYCAARAEASGALEEYIIRKNAMDGWKEVCQAWASLGADAAAEDRVRAARDLQEEIEKFGDIQLFEAIAGADTNLWHRNGSPEPTLLDNEVRRRNAHHDSTRFKVPAYRHPDPLVNPVFCDYGKSRWRIWYSAQEGPGQAHPRTITLDTFEKGAIAATEYRWQSKRLFHEIASGAGEVEGSRNHRHAQAIHADQGHHALRAGGIFELKDWNGRLQAPRTSLERIQRLVERKAPADVIQKAKRRIPWLVTFSAPLRPEGPWLDFVEADPTLRGTNAARELAPKSSFEFAGLAYPFDHPDNGKSRKKEARIGLARLKGLRILSADLGHRHAAACAVWRSLDAVELAERCRAAGVPVPAGTDLFLHLREGGKTVVFRRTAGDLLPGGRTHPAPWAELERQFLIQLPGEDSQARYANPAERQRIVAIENLMGASVRREAKNWRMDRLQLDLIRLARLGLRRHGTMARLATGLGASERVLPGARTAPFSSREERLKFVADLLVQQHRLVMDEHFPDEDLRGRWKETAGAFLTAADLSDMPAGRRRDNTALAKRLEGLASRLIDQPALAEEWIGQWREKWQAMDNKWREVIREVRNILMPRASRNDKTVRRRGGLSMARITAIEEFRRKVQVAYFTRQKLEGTRGEVPLSFASRALRRLEKLRENRVRHIASRLAGAALGIGPDPADSGKLVKRFPACHAVVIENLTNYRPESTQTRRENRQLMQWSSGKVRKLLAEACQLAGLHLREVKPAFTSRQDSRTGAPGLRCAEVSWAEFRKPDGYWSRQAEKAREKEKTGKANAVERYLVRLAGLEGQPRSATVLIPRKGADLFTSASDAGPLALQADLNAAANIGLAALLDPDWPGRWWFVPAGRDTHQPEKELATATPVGETGSLPVAESASPTASAKKRGRGTPSAVAWHFRDASSAPLAEGVWFVGFPAYEAEYSARVVRRLERRVLPLPETPF